MFGHLEREPIVHKVPADFNTSAVFLEKYMQLNDDDRHAIGHRLYHYLTCQAQNNITFGVVLF
jgi:hypothetical protein